MPWREANLKTFSAKAVISCEAASRKLWGQFGSAGSGQSDAQMTARQAANGRRADQMMQRRDVPVPDRLLPAGVGADPLDGQVDLDQALGVHSRHRCSMPARHVAQNGC